MVFYWYNLVTYLIKNMANINKNYLKISPSYFFIEIIKKAKAFQEKNPDAQLYRLGIGNTTEALPPAIIKGLKSGVEKLANQKTYTGYGDEQGDTRLRAALAEWYAERGVKIMPQEVFISDGAKPDTGNIQSIFDVRSIVAVQDPVYPVYVDSNVLAGRTGKFIDGHYEGLVYMPCTPENDFCPVLPDGKIDLIYLCSPNNPTGTVLNKKQLKYFVDYALKNKSVIVFDSAYSTFIKDNKLPRSIYEIEGAKKCAIEISSFSKWAGFTGVRLGWSIVPMELAVEDSEVGQLNTMWNRRQTTIFNGASNIAQEGGLAVLTPEGRKECQNIVDYYMENASIIKKGISKLGLTAYGGDNAPYIWLKTPGKMSSWEFFDKLLSEAHVVGTPGVGFGPHGEGFLRISAFGHRENIVKAISSINTRLKI